jgi:undecaprenyl-phosphate 4-deoxy-4-formamido-L-arabinose transferase
LPAPLPSGLSAVIPVYNSERSLRLVVERLAAVLPHVRERYEVILVNDGSRDRSWEVIQELRRDFPFVSGINLMRNCGQHNALLCGIRAARFDIIATLDDDLQNPPEELPKLLAGIEGGLDVVYGPPERESHGFLRDAASVITKITLQNAMGAETARNISAYRAFRTATRDAFANFNSPFVSIDVLLSWASTRFGFVRVKHDPRTIGTSNYTLGKLVLHALNMLTGFSTLPLRLASLVGFVFTGFGVATLLYIICLYLVRGTPVQGFPFLASIISAFAGAQLFTLGIMGEYLGRVHFRMMDRPPYVVRDTLGPTQTSE